MSDKITVRVSFTTRASWTKDVEMTRDEYARYCERLDGAMGRDLRNLQEDIGEELDFDFTEAPEFEDAELDDFYEVGD